MSNPSRRTAVAAVAAGALAALALPAAAASTSAPAHGTASSGLTLLRLTLGNASVSAGTVSAVAANIHKPHKVQLVVTPLSSSVTGPIGQQKVTPSSGTSTIPSATKSTAFPGGLGSVTGPTFVASAVDKAALQRASVVLKALGKVTIATVPINLGVASLNDVASVTSKAATAGKELQIGNLGLPSVQDLLSSLGVNVNALLAQLSQGKLNSLGDLVGTVAPALNNAVDAAQAAIAAQGHSPANSLAAATGQLSYAQSSASAADSAYSSALASALGSVPAPVATALSAAGLTSSTTPAQFAGLSSGAMSTITGLLGSSTASALATDATNAVDAAALVTQVNALVDALQALVNGVLAALTGNDDPIAALSNIDVKTSAIAAAKPKAIADVSVGSVHVLGIAAALPISSLNSALASVSKTLGSVLNSVPGVTFSAPSIVVGKALHNVGHRGKTSFASASITGAVVTLPSITLPSALHLPGVPTGIGGALTIGQLADFAAYTPAKHATASKSGTTAAHSSGSLPDTGGRAGLALAGAATIIGALALRRRFAGTA